jgi:hypothetical protein
MQWGRHRRRRSGGGRCGMPCRASIACSCGTRACHCCALFDFDRHALPVRLVLPLARAF